jgi:hypothetical protein
MINDNKINIYVAARYFTHTTAATTGDPIRGGGSHGQKLLKPVAGATMQVCEFNAQIYTSSIRNNALHDFILN